MEKMLEIIKQLAADIQKDKAQSEHDVILNDGALKGLSALIQRIEVAYAPDQETRWEEQRVAEAEVAAHNAAREAVVLDASK